MNGVLLNEYKYKKIALKHVSRGTQVLSNPLTPTRSAFLRDQLLHLLLIAALFIKPDTHKILDMIAMMIIMIVVKMLYR